MPELLDTYMLDLAGTTGDPSAFSELVFGTPFHPGQQRYTREANGQVNFLLPGNSWGKTEFILRFALYNGWFKGDFLWDAFETYLERPFRILIASYNYDTAGESFTRLENYVRNRPEVNALVATMNKQDHSVRLHNGTVIDWGSLDGQGRLVEAARYNVIFVDEVGHIPDLAYTYDSILYPRTMGVAGVIHLLGTPKSHSDPYLLEIYEKGKNGGDGFYFSQSGAVDENTFWPEGEKLRVLKNPRYVRGWQPCDGCTEKLCYPEMGGHPLLTPMGRQVLLGAFIIEGGLFFNRLYVKRIFDRWTQDPSYPTTWVGEDHFSTPKQPGHIYAAAWDLAGNKLRKRNRRSGSDPTVGMVADVTQKPWRIVRYDFIHGGDADWQDKYSLIADVAKEFDVFLTAIDSTGQQDTVVEALELRGIQVDGIHFGGSSNKKIDMLRNLQLVMELEYDGKKGCLTAPAIPRVRHELEHYILPDEGIAQDTVMTLAMLAHQIILNEVPEYSAGEVW